MSEYYWSGQVRERESEIDRLRRELAERDAALAVAVAALRLHQAWADSEDAGPNYGGQTRATHPDGERIWREWWDANLSLCARANDETKRALANLPASARAVMECVDMLPEIVEILDSNGYKPEAKRLTAALAKMNGGS